MLPPPQSPTPTYLSFLLQKEGVSKWSAFLLTSVVLWDIFPYLATIPARLLSLLWPLLAAPFVFLLNPLIVGSFLFNISVLVILVSILVLFIKKRYLAILIVEILLLIISVTSLENFSQIMQVGKKSGLIPSSDDAPAGILNLPLQAVPKGYFLGQKGNGAEYNYSPNLKKYIKEYHANIRTGGDMDIIKFSYGEQECPDFYLSPYEDTELATCQAGPCILNKTSTFWEFQINDNGACAIVAFSLGNSLTREEMQKVVDSLERVPGERPSRSFEEKATPSMYHAHSILVAWKKEHNNYDRSGKAFPLTLSQETCKSTLSIDISPDKQSYVIHRPLCPNQEMSYCMENGQNEMTKVSTEQVEQTYHCK